MKTFYTIFAYAISIVFMLIVIYKWNSEYVKPAAVAIVGALVIQQGVKWIFRDQIKGSKFKQNVESAFANIPDVDDDDSDDGNDEPTKVARGEGEEVEENGEDEFRGRPDEDGY